MPRKQTSGIYGRALKLLSSQLFFRIIVGLLIFQALWIAFSNRYPMAFDEDYHFGIIKLYAHHLNPFWDGQPAGANSFGAMFRDPSYLFHYVLSFPLRLIGAFIDNQATQVLLLRLLNIALFTSSLLIFRRLFQRFNVSAALSNCLLLLYVLIPVVPLLAAQINYDNVFIPAVALLMLWLVDWCREVVRRKRINGHLLLQILILCCLSSIVKYPFLPFFLVSLFIMVIVARLTLGSWHQVLRNIAFGMTLMTKRMRWLLLGVLFVSVGLCVERYGVNLVRYHTPVPDCAQVLSVQDCSAYGPWIRDYTLESQKISTPHNPAAYMVSWLEGMWLRLFFAVDGPITQFQTRGPLTIPVLSAAIFAGLSLLLTLRYLPRLWRKYRGLFIPLMLSLFYVVVLWLDGFESYQRTATPVAINGRYLLPILPVLFLMAALAWRELLTKRPRLKLAVATVAIISLLWGGGVLTFILRSSDSWYWQNTAVRSANDAVRDLIAPVVPGADRPTQFLP